MLVLWQWAHGVVARDLMVFVHASIEEGEVWTGSQRILDLRVDVGGARNLMEDPPGPVVHVDYL